LSSKNIELRGVAVHNLKHVDLDIPHHQLVVLCGVSGSGKTSLALDTLYAEGQRRYLESLSVESRAFLEQLQKPDVERIDHLPAAIAVTRGDVSRSSRATVATTTEIIDYLRLLYARVGRLVCPSCGQSIHRSSPQEAAESLAALPAGHKFMVAFLAPIKPQETPEQRLAQLREAGFVRSYIVGSELIVIVDRLTAGQPTSQRVSDSLEIAFREGDGRALAFIEPANNQSDTLRSIDLDGRTWQRLDFLNRLQCPSCSRQFPDPDPRHFSFNSPLGACRDCEGFGDISDWDLDLIVPDQSKSLREGAIAPWNTPKYRHELDELLALAPDYHIPTNVPYSELTPAHRKLIKEGVPERSFGGLEGFFRWLERHKYKLHYRVFMKRWRSSRPCPTCRGSRLNEDALAWHIGGLNIAQATALRVDAAAQFFASLPLTPHEQAVTRSILPQVVSRLHFLEEVGVGYLTLCRRLRTLSGGEAQRIALTAALGSSLVNMLYILDEPSVGLHPRDVERLVASIRRLASRKNSVVIVEHEEAFLRAADEVIEIGPGAGDRGGEVVFQGPPAAMLAPGASLTGEFLAGRRGVALPAARRQPNRGRIKLLGARGNNLKNVTVDFPLNCLCVVSGVSGAGKSTLVQDTLYGALARRKGKKCDDPLPFDDVVGCGQIDDCLLVDQTPIGRSARSNPITYIKAFDAIRQVFADSLEARTRNYSASHFSFNVEGGRCEKCQGEGRLHVDMQFMPDVYLPCSQCGGARYRKEILAVKYRNKSIAEVLAMTAREAFAFFRGQTKVQARLKQLIDVGLEYLQLGQPANTLSAGEAQRLKLAAHLSEASKSRTLFLLDEPTTGLHFADIVVLLDCFEALLSVGHSLIVVEHNLQLIRAADYLIDLGPEAGENGGQVIATGAPEEVAQHKTSHTARFLAASLTNLQSAN
jgi:excinuclease ABC subunit A